VSPTGQTDVYNISRAGQTNQWNVWLDGNPIGLSTVTGSWNGAYSQIGGEYTGIDTAYGRADNFDMQELASTNGGNTYVAPPLNSFQIDPRSGFEGTSYGTGEWSWQKHAPW